MILYPSPVKPALGKFSRPSPIPTHLRPYRVWVKLHLFFPLLLTSIMGPPIIGILGQSVNAWGAKITVSTAFPTPDDICLSCKRNASSCLCHCTINRARHRPIPPFNYIRPGRGWIKMASRNLFFRQRFAAISQSKLNKLPPRLPTKLRSSQKWIKSVYGLQQYLLLILIGIEALKMVILFLPIFGQAGFG